MCKSLLTHLPPTLRKRNALFENCEKIQDCKIKHKGIYVLLTGRLLCLVVAYAILFVYVCFFCWIMQICWFLRLIGSLFQNIFSGIRCYFFKFLVCLLAVLMPVFHINCLLLVCLFVYWFAKFWWLLRFRNFGGMWYKIVELGTQWTLTPTLIKRSALFGYLKSSKYENLNNIKYCG